MAEGMTCYEQDEALCEDQMCLRDGPKWIKHWQREFLSGIYRAQHEHDIEQARRYAEAAPSDGAIYAAVSQRNMTDAEREQLNAALSRPNQPSQGE